MELIQPTETIELIHENGNWQLGRGKGFSPVQLVAASAAACSAYVFEELLDQRQIQYRLIRVSVEYTENPYPPNPIAQIDVRLLLEAAKSVQEAVKQIFLEIPGHCPVIQSLNPKIRINEAVYFTF